MNIKYEVTLQVHPSQGGDVRKLVLDVPDTGDEGFNKSGALSGAFLMLDKEGVTRCTLKNIAKVTS